MTTSSRDAGITQYQGISTLTCCLQFRFTVPLRPAAYKIVFVLPLPLSILPPEAKTNTRQHSNTPIPVPEKKKKERKKEKENENLTAHMWHRNTKVQFLGEKRQQLCFISVFLPFFPTLIFLPHTTLRKTQRVSSAWDPGQRVKDTSCSTFTALPALLRWSLLFWWGWAEGRQAPGQPH